MDLEEFGALLWGCAVGVVLGLGAWQTGASVILAVGIGFFACVAMQRLLVDNT